MVDNDDLEIGKAGEHLVCADIISQGYGVSIASAGMHYDIIADINGKLIKIQVKTSRRPKLCSPKYQTYGYLYHVRRMGKKGRKTYKEGEVDIFALVGLDIKKIAYLRANKIKQTMVFRNEPTKIKVKNSRFFDDFSLERCLNGD